MKPAPFTYHAPTTLPEAVDLLRELGESAKVLAGGQSLVPLLNMRLASPAHLVDINRVAGLDEIDTSDGVCVGALVRHARLEHDADAAAAQPLLARALAHVAHPAIRNRGTTVGSIAHADPCGEMPAILAITDGHVEIAGPGGTRTVAAREFFVGPMESVLEPDDLLTAVRFGAAEPGEGSAYDEFARRSGDYALAGVAVRLGTADGAVTWARASFVSVTDVPDVLDLSDVLRGMPLAEPDPARLAEAGRLARDHVDPVDDIHASARYRAHLAEVLTRRVAEAALRDARGDRPADEAGDAPGAPDASIRRRSA